MADIGKRRRTVRVEPIGVPKERPTKEPPKEPAKAPERKRELTPA